MTVHVAAWSGTDAGHKLSTRADSNASRAAGAFLARTHGRRCRPQSLTPSQVLVLHLVTELKKNGANVYTYIYTQKLQAYP